MYFMLYVVGTKINMDWNEICNHMPKFIAKNDWEFSMNILLSWKVVWFSCGCKWGTNVVKKKNS